MFMGLGRIEDVYKKTQVFWEAVPRERHFWACRLWYTLEVNGHDIVERMCKQWPRDGENASGCIG